MILTTQREVEEIFHHYIFLPCTHSLYWNYHLHDKDDSASRASPGEYHLSLSCLIMTDVVRRLRLWVWARAK